MDADLSVGGALYGTERKRGAQQIAADAFESISVAPIDTGWFAAGEAAQEFEALNAQVYEELFAMPKSDPWLGLVDEMTYDGLFEGANAARG